jgi:hypothetical protein
MDICEEKVISRWSMKKEIEDDLENYDEINDDIIREICDSLVPVYNAELIDMACHYSGEEYWDIWNDNQLGGETPLEIVRGNIFCLYLEIGQEVLSEREETE